MSRLHGIADWLDARLRGARRDHELDEEIAYHLELEEARLRSRGHDPESARAIALARFGDVARVREQTRDARGRALLDGHARDFQWAVRSLRRQPGFTLLALVTLALGIGATTTAFTVLETVILRPLPYADPERLVLIEEVTPARGTRPPSYPNFADWRTTAASFSGIASMMYAAPMTVIAGDEPVRATTQGASLGFLSVLGVRPHLGRDFTADEQRPGAPLVAIVSYEFWRQHLGGRRSPGTIRFFGTEAPVVGVMPPGFRIIDDVDVWFPHERMPGSMRSAHNYRVFARLAPGADLAAARVEMTTISRALRATHGEATEAVDALVTPMREYLVGDYRGMLTVVFGAAALVLLIACTNLVSSQLARGMARQHEVAMRAALGASRGRLVQLLLAETAVLVGLGAALGAALAVALIRAVRTLGAGLVPRLEELSVDGSALAFVAATAIVSVVLAGIYPALRLSLHTAAEALRLTRGSRGAVRRTVWRALVGFEVATAFMLLVGSALLIRTLRNILDSDTGFDPRGVLTAAMAPQGLSHADLEHVRAGLEAIPGAERVAFTTRLPLEWGNESAPVLRPGDPADRDYPARAGFRVVSAGYFEVLRQPALSGRTFTDADRAGTTDVAVITTGIASRLWPGEDPIGKRIASNYLGARWLTVVGVVAEASSWSMPRGTQNEIFVPLAQHPEWTLYQLVAVMRARDDVNALATRVRARLRELAPMVPARVSTIEERIARSAADRRFAMFALTGFGAIALALSAIGIYGVVSYSVAARTREIGIRMALGAAPGRIRRHVLGEAAAMTVGGIAIGVIGGVLTTRFLDATLYGVDALDPSAFAAGGAVLLGAALLGAWVPARWASRVDPQLAIRSE